MDSIERLLYEYHKRSAIKAKISFEKALAETISKEDANLIRNKILITVSGELKKSVDLIVRDIDGIYDEQIIRIKMKNHFNEALMSAHEALYSDLPDEFHSILNAFFDEVNN